jgi:phosphomannomutase
VSTIRFGTDGWSAIIAEEFTFANVRRVAQAIARYVTTGQAGNGNGLVIGYDQRFQSEHAARLMAEVLAGNGIDIWLTGAATPAPVTAFNAKALGTAGAVLITAGNRPPEYNGIRFIPASAAPAGPEVTGAIAAILDQLPDGDAELLPPDLHRQDGLIREFDPKPAYLDHLQKLLKPGTICRGRLRVVFDPMWGTGIGYLEDLLQDGCARIDTIHNCRDILCGGQLPGFQDAAELRRAVLQNQADLGLALDGNAERFMVMDRDGSVIDSNEVIYMLLHYLTEYRNWRGAVARTVASSRMIDRIAADYGLPVVETPVGFQQIAESLIKHRSILGGDESGELSIQGHVPYPDGILALALVVEMVSSRGKSLQSYREQIQQQHGSLVGGRLNLDCDRDTMKTCLERLQQWAPGDLAGMRVLERRADDGINLVLDNGCWVLIRVSGTEPLFQIYAEAPDLEILRRIQQCVRQVLGL